MLGAGGWDVGAKGSCFNLDASVLTVNDGKGQKDRAVPLSEILLPTTRQRFTEAA
jgi:integrase